MGIHRLPADFPKRASNAESVSMSWCHHVDFTCLSSFSNQMLNTLRSRQNGRHFADDIFKCIFLNENAWSFHWSLFLGFKLTIFRPGDKPLSGPMMLSLLTHICVTRPQWVNSSLHISSCVCSSLFCRTHISITIYLNQTSSAENCHMIIRLP